MPTCEHELLIDMFRYQPTLAPVLLHDALGVEIPAYHGAHVESAELTQCVPTEYRADAVVRLTGEEQDTAIVVEVQRGRDPGKRWSWPVYLAALRARLHGPAVLLVICPDESTASWCATPIEMGHPGWVLHPFVVGPNTVPAVVHPEDAAAQPELAVLSAIAHGSDPAVLDALVNGLRAVDDERYRMYTDYVLEALPEAARKYLEDLMATGTYEFKSDFAKKYIAYGRIERTAEDVLTVLTARGVSVPDEIRERIMACADPDELETWVWRAATAEAADELFA